MNIFNQIKISSFATTFFIFAALFGLSRVDYLLFHAYAEIFSIIIAASIFLNVWNMRKILDNGYFLILGVLLLFVANIDLLHTLLYKGMKSSAYSGTNAAAFLWIAGRFLQAAAFVSAAYFTDRKTNIYYIFSAGAAYSLIITGLFYYGNFPDCFTVESGLTPFKIYSEYLICLMLFAGAWGLYSKRKLFEGKIYVFLQFSILLAASAEIIFTFYKGPYSLYNMFGHIIKIFSYFFMYKAVIENGLVKPATIYFRNLSAAKEQLLSKSKKLEGEIVDRETFLKEKNIELSVQKKEKEEVRKKLVDRDKVLEDIYKMATGYRESIEDLCKSAAFSIYDRLGACYVCILIKKDGSLMTAARVFEGEEHSRDKEDFNECGLFKEAMKQKIPVFSDKDSPCSKDGISHKYTAVFPIVTFKKEAAGAICVGLAKKEGFGTSEKALIEVTSKYLSAEYYREKLEREIHRNKRIRMLSRMVSGVAHEVRNPLNSILSLNDALFAELSDDGIYDRYSEYIDHIHSQINRLSNLMKDLLNMGKPIDKNSLKKMNLKKFVQNLHSEWSSPGVNNRNCRTEFINGVFSDRISIKVNEMKMQQVFLNLLENACQHSPEKGLVVLECNVINGIQTVIRVSDMGPGVEEENIGKIFDPFFTTRKEGTGLGLSIVKHIIELHGGRIRAFNRKDGNGLVMEVVIPSEESD